jgi:iron complex outermembrane receptor protein
VNRQQILRYLSLSLPLLCQSTVVKAQEAVEEIIVIGRQEFLETEFTAQRTGSNVDAAKLMNQVPGGAANNNGPLTGQIQYRGMFGPRVNVRVDGMLINGGGPNWMAPPLHHIPAGLMEELVVEQGIPSIATGGGIGGAATAYWKRPAYNSGNGWNFTGDTEASFGSADEGSSVSGLFALSSSTHKIYAVGSFDEGDDYDSEEGRVDSTEYERDVFGIGYGFRSGAHELEVNVHRIETEDTGTPSLPMDIDWFDTDVWNVSYTTELNGVGINLRVYGSDIDHGMSNYLLRPVPDFSSLMLPPFMGDDKRNVVADSEEFGFKLSIDFALGAGVVVAGIEGKDSEHDSTVGDPDFMPFFVNNFNDTDADSLSVFGQWSALIGSRWYLEAGLRAEDYDSSTGTVDAFPARLVDMNPAMWPMGTPPRAVFMLRQAFNNADRSQSDNNLDWLLKGRYQATDNLVIELAVAQKTRSPIYQERYLWIPLEANAGIGDGNNYIGNPDLDPEESQQIELGFDWDFGDYYFSPRIYYREVDDFIQGVPATNMLVVAVSANANGDPTPLIFANTDATYEGIDLTFGARINDQWRIEGLASMVDGERDDISDNLYRVSPDTLRASLIYESGNFGAKIEQAFFAKQDDLSATNTLDPASANNSFASTDSYELTNVYLNWFLGSQLAIAAGVENLFDEDYVDHLTGFNRVIGSNVPVGSRLFGHGRNVFVRFQYQW